MQELKDECEFLTDFYIETRYPVHWPTDITKEDAEKAKFAVKKIGAFIKNLLYSNMP